MEHALRVAAYCRVSTDSEEQLSSYENQLSYYTEKIMKEPGWTMAGVFAFSPTRACQAPPSAGPDSPSCSGWPGRGRWI